jgi:hypothetical protein
VYAGDTAGHAATINNYGNCASGMIGPELVYKLEVPYFLQDLVISLGASADLRGFLFTGNSPANCFAVITQGPSVILHDIGAGTYYLVIDGPTAGRYTVSIRCQPAVAYAMPRLSAVR